MPSLGMLWILALIPFRYIGYKVYKVTDRNNVINVCKRLKANALILDNGEEPLSFSYGRLTADEVTQGDTSKWSRFKGYYVAYVHVESSTNNRGSSTYIWLFSTDQQYKKLIEKEISLEDIKDTNVDKVKLVTYPREGPAWNRKYMKDEIEITKIMPVKEQQEVTEKIMELYNAHRNNKVVAYIYGIPGSGKSCIGDILAQTNGVLVDDFNPTDLGDEFKPLYSKIAPTRSKPLILVLDEVDKIIDKIHYHSEKLQNKHYDRIIYNGQTWNKFFDKVERRYSNIIIIMTSNRKPEEILAMDKSYLRQRRVDIFFEMNKSILDINFNDIKQQNLEQLALEPKNYLEDDLVLEDTNDKLEIDDTNDNDNNISF